MIQTLKKNALLSLIIGIVLIVLGVIFRFVATDIGESIKNFAIGVLLVVLIVVLVFPDLKKKNSNRMFYLIVLEIVITLFAAAMFITGTGGNPSLWIGLVVYMHGLVELIGGYFSGNKQRFERFIIAVILVTLGVYIFAANIITNEMLMNVLFVLFVVPGLFLTVVGAVGLSNTPKKSKKSKKTA